MTFPNYPCPEDPDVFMQLDFGFFKSIAKLTYREADSIAQDIDLTVLRSTLAQLDSSTYIGDLYAVIYRFLVASGTFQSDKSYDNSMEYMYDKIVKRLVAEHFLKVDHGDYYRVSTVGELIVAYAEK